MSSGLNKLAKHAGNIRGSPITSMCPYDEKYSAYLHENFAVRLSLRLKFLVCNLQRFYDKGSTGSPKCSQHPAFTHKHLLESIAL